MVTALGFTALVLAVAAQRLWEVRKSRRHERALRAAGAREAAPQQMPIMKAVHGAWLVSMLAEVWFVGRPFFPWLAVGALVVFSAGQALRVLAMRELGERWTVKIIVLPEAPPISGGIFRHIRHPNYLGVILEIAALPLIHGAWMTAVVFSIANGILLFHRVRAEEAALSGVSDYPGSLGAKPRFVPTGRSAR